MTYIIGKTYNGDIMPSYGVYIIMMNLQSEIGIGEVNHTTEYVVHYQIGD